MPADKVVVTRRATRLAIAEPALQNLTVGVREYGLHAHTVEEELRTLHNRHLFQTPTPDEGSEAWAAFKKAMRHGSKEIGQVPIANPHSILKGKAGRARRRMCGGFAKYMTDGLSRKDPLIKEMQKLELYEVSQLAVKENRGIQYRSVTYNAALARHLWHVEHRLCQLMGTNRTVSCVAKGKDQGQRAVQLLRLAYHFRNPVFYLLDHSRFDAHVCEALLREEHKSHLRCRRYNPELVKLLKHQLENRGRTAGGIDYFSRGKRMSGDINTGTGNTKINKGLLQGWLEASDVHGEFVLDGDDSVVVVEADDEQHLLPIEQFMLECGMVTECIRTTKISEVEFCQAKIVWSRNGPWLCGNPKKRLAMCMVSAENVDAGLAPAIFAGKVACELAFTPAVPMFKPLWLLASSLEQRAQVAERSHFRLRELGVEPDTISVPKWLEPNPDERISYALAWGVSPNEQKAYEDEVIIKPVWASAKAPRHPRPKAITAPADWLDGFGEDPEDQAGPSLDWADQSEDFRQWAKHILTTG